MAATETQLRNTYRFMAPMVRSALSPRDITCAMFKGDFRLSLSQGEQRKHAYVLDELRITEDSLFLDVGFGWGSLLEAARERGAKAVGVNKETGQVRFARSLGLNVVEGSYRDFLTVNNPVQFDGISCVEAMEHFCGPEDYVAGEQDAIYGDFFARAAEHLVDGGRMYHQSMVLGKDVPRFDDISTDAPPFSREYIAAKVMEFYPGSWPPESVDQIIRAAAPYFDVLEVDNGTADYIETMKRWSELWRPNTRTILPILSLAAKALLDPNIRKRIGLLRQGYNRQCFEKGVLELSRILFQKKSDVFKPENAANIASYLSGKLSGMGLPDIGVDSTDELLDTVYSGDNAILYVHKNTGKVLVLDKIPGIVSANPESARLWIHGKRWEETTQLYTEAASKDLNSRDFWQSWSRQFWRG